MDRLPSYGELLARLATCMPVTPDGGPSAEATLRALWFSAAGQSCPTDRVCKEPLPLLDEKEQLQLLDLIEELLAGRERQELAEV